LYISLDSANRGVLREADILQIDCDFGSFVFPVALAERVFLVLGISNGEMDFREFVTFLFPLKYLRSRQSAAFFFPILDVDGDGVISAEDAVFWYQSLSRVPGARLPDKESYVAEIFDMCQCQEFGITQTELVGSGQQEEVIKALIDASDHLEVRREDHARDENEEEEE
jgi:Ca2+-binding EF-hand superfamily protein